MNISKNLKIKLIAQKQRINRKREEKILIPETKRKNITKPIIASQKSTKKRPQNFYPTIRKTRESRISEDSLKNYDTFISKISEEPLVVTLELTCSKSANPNRLKYHPISTPLSRADKFLLSIRSKTISKRPPS